MKHFAWTLVTLGMLVTAASADTLMLKDGTVLECKVLDRRTELIHGEIKAVYVVEVSGGTQKTFLEEEVAWVQRMRVSWEARAEALKWYSIQKDHVAPAWQAHFDFARECRRKRLYEQSFDQFGRAYQLRRKETPDTVEGHEQLAEWLLNECELYSEAGEEFRIVYRARAKEAKTAEQHLALGKWCEKRTLYDEAEREYQAALKLRGDYADARKALENLRKVRMASFHPRFYRDLKAPFSKSIDWLQPKQNRDGSYGGELVAAGVQAHRGVSSIAGLALIRSWELSRIERETPLPAEVAGVLKYMLARPPNRKALRGPDIWGNLWGIPFLVKCYSLRQFRNQRAAIKAKLDEIYAELARVQGPRGGWMYYHFAHKSGAAFVTAAMILAFLDARREGVGPDQAMIDRAVAHMKVTQLGEANYTYRTGVRLPIEGNAARGPLCSLAMLVTGNGSRQELRNAIDNFFKHRHIIKKIKGKRGTHIGPGRTAPYYYLYGHYWTARAIKSLERPLQNAYLTKLKEAILPDQLSDGVFSDWPRFRHHKVAGTSLGAMTLYQLMSLSADYPVARRAAPPPPPPEKKTPLEEEY